MLTISRRFLLSAGAATLVASPALAAPEPQAVASEIANAITELPGVVMLGSASPDVTLYEFFDYNCPFCRRAAAELPALLKAEPEIGYGLVNFAVLGIASIGATKVALAFAEGRSAADYFKLHEGLFRLRGQVTGERAVSVAVSLGAKTQALLDRANSEEIGQRALAAVKLGDQIGLQATPSYLAGTETVAGYVSLDEKRRLIANFRSCEKLAC